jgi:hypothetical protein
MVLSGNQPQLRACRVGALSVLLAAAALAQAAPDATPVLVQYEAPESCPSQAVFEGALLFRSPRIGMVSAAEQAAVTARVRVTQNAKGAYRGVLELAPRDGAASERAIGGTRCSSVVEALSLAAALLLDPEGVRSAPLPSVSELERLAEAARAAAAPTTEPTPPAEPAPPPASAPSPARPAPPAPAPPRPPLRAESTDDSGPRRLSVALFGGATSAVHGLDGQAGLGVELAFGAGGLELGPHLAAGFGLERRVSASAGSVVYQPFEVRAGVCAGPRPSRFELAGCAGAALVLLTVDAPEADTPRPSLRALPSLGLGPRLAYRFGAFALGLELGAGVHLSAERFRIEPEGEVFRLPRVHGRGAIFLRFDALAFRALRGAETP